MVDLRRMERNGAASVVMKVGARRLVKRASRAHEQPHLYRSLSILTVVSAAGWAWSTWSKRQRKLRSADPVDRTDEASNPASAVPINDWLTEASASSPPQPLYTPPPALLFGGLSRVSSTTDDNTEVWTPRNAKLVAAIQSLPIKRLRLRGCAIRYGERKSLEGKWLPAKGWTDAALFSR
jgi:hypothetical protein